jgi:hypothetical protein
VEVRVDEQGEIQMVKMWQGLSSTRWALLVAETDGCFAPGFGGNPKDGNLYFKGRRKRDRHAGMNVYRRSGKNAPPARRAGCVVADSERRQRRGFAVLLMDGAGSIRSVVQNAGGR